MATTINNKTYAWGGIKIRYGNKIVAEAKEIEYEVTQEIDEVYAAGSNPYGPGFGNISRKGKVVVLEEWAHKLQEEANQKGDGYIQNLQFQFDVIKNDGVNAIVVDKLLNVVAKSNKRSAKQGDKELTVEYELYIGDIKFNA